MGWVGEFFWTHGPIVLGTPELRRVWHATLPKSDAVRLTGIKKAFSRFENEHGPAWVLPGGNHTTWIPVDARSGFLVRRDNYLHPRRVEMLVDILEPSWFTGPWRKLTSFHAETPLHLFDTVSGAIAAHEGEELQKAQAESRCDNYFVLELDAGDYVVHKSQATIVVESREAVVTVFRLRREGHTMPTLVSVEKPSKPEPLQVTSGTIELAKSLKFVGTDGGPFVLIHESDLARWYGVVDEDGEFIDEPDDADYWRACGIGMVGVVEGIRGVQTLAIDGPIAHAFHRTADGGIFIGWQGADTAAGCLAAVLAQTEDAWSYEDFTFEIRGPAILMDANRDGRDFDRERWPRIELETGRYLVAQLVVSATNEFDGEVRHPDGTLERLMVSAIRLRGPLRD